MLKGAMAGPMAGQMANGCGGMAATQMQRGGGLALQAGVLARSSVGNCGRRVVGSDADAATAAACDLRRYLSCSVRNAPSQQPGGLSSCAMHLPSSNSKGTSCSQRENLRGPTKRFAFPLAQRTPGNRHGEVSRFLLPFPCANQDALSPKRGMSPLRATSSAESAFPEVSAVAEADQVALPSKFEEVVDVLTNLFPVWVVIGSVVALWRPAMVTWIQTDTFTLGLGLLMLSMGLTLTFEDFRRCLRNPWTVGVGFLAQYVIKPLLGFSISLALGLPAPLATGLILVSCCPGGQASNVATYISKGNVALSVLMTTCSTIGAIIMTPLLTKVLAGQLIPVDAVGLAVSTFQVVLLPTIVGVLANEFFPSFTRKITFFTPLVGVILTTLLCASPIGQVAGVLKTQGVALIAPVALLHVFAFFIGYWLSRACNFGEVTSRTVSIECGMQSSALGFLLAQKHFTNPLVAVPSAVSVVFMALGGAMLAVFWRMKGIPPNDKDDFKE